MFRRIKNITRFIKFIGRNGIGDTYHKLYHIELERIILAARKNYDIDKSVYFGGGTQIYGKGTIKIEKDTYLGYNCMIQCDPKEALISIGTGCSISHNVQIRTSTYDLSYGNLKDSRTNPSLSKDILIGNDVWIGANVFINPGVKIADNSVIGANCVVTKDVPENSIFGGVPGKVLRYKNQ